MTTASCIHHLSVLSSRATAAGSSSPWVAAIQDPHQRRGFGPPIGRPLCPSDPQPFAASTYGIGWRRVWPMDVSSTNLYAYAEKCVVNDAEGDYTLRGLDAL